ncbi:MAG: DUF6565 domain-containing protein [Flavobacteriaceae bacterium]
MKLYQFITLLLLTIFMTSCAPQTKESYLLNYKKFTDEVTENHKNYTAKDWLKKDKEFAKFKRVIKERYQNELSFQDELMLVKHEASYNLLKFQKETPNFLNLFKGDFEKLKQQLKDYTKNDMGKDVKVFKTEIEHLKKELKNYTENNLKGDVEQLKKEMELMGKDFEDIEKAMEELFEEIEK